MKLLIEKKSGMKYRPNTCDELVIKESNGYKYIYDVCKDKIVFDIGANIGTFTNNAIKAGAAQVFAYEPEEENFSVLSKQDFNSTNKVVLQKVAIMNYNGKIPFYVSKPESKGKDRHSAVKIRGRIETIVNGISLWDEIKRYNPTILKMDTEGGEFYLDWRMLPKTIEYIAIEIHCKQDRDNQADWILNFLKDEFHNHLYEKTNMFFNQKDTYIFVGGR